MHSPMPPAADPSSLPRVLTFESFPAAEFGGNIASVVLHDGRQATAWLQGIASDLCSPTTAFIDLRDADPKQAPVRFFTPTREIDACGHATVAAATALVEVDTWATPSTTILHTLGGAVPITLDIDGDSRLEVGLAYEQRSITIAASAEPQLAFGHAVDTATPCLLVETGLRHLMVPIKTAAALHDLRPDPSTLRTLADSTTADTIGAYATPETDGPSTAHMRDFCIAIGDFEEAASGTTSCALGLTLAYLDKSQRGSRTLEVLMGKTMGRPSRLRVDVQRSTRGRMTASVRGSAECIMRGRLQRVPASTASAERP